jgi:hypothetical protein
MGIANELTTRGWTRGIHRDEDGAVCLEGAAMCAAGAEVNLRDGFIVIPTEPAQRSAYYAAMDALHDVIRAREGGFCSVPYWNDDVAEDFDDVLRVAKEADELLDAG